MSVNSVVKIASAPANVRFGNSFSGVMSLCEMKKKVKDPVKRIKASRRMKTLPMLSKHPRKMKALPK